MENSQMNDIRVEPCRSLQDFRAMENLQLAIWKGTLREVVPYDILLAISDGGGTVFGAWHRDKLIGMALSFVAMGSKGPYHHSHLLGVLPEYRQYGVGKRLKLSQRDAVLSQGIRLITWTFDPLESINAYLNFCRLGVVSRTYKKDYYGSMSEEINKGLPTDRLLVEWHLESVRVPSACEESQLAVGTCSPAQTSCDIESRSFSSNCDTSNKSALLLIEIPADIQRIKAENPDAALDWRLTTRESFLAAFAKGYVATGYRPPDESSIAKGCYVLRRSPTNNAGS